MLLLNLAKLFRRLSMRQGIQKSQTRESTLKSLALILGGLTIPLLERRAFPMTDRERFGMWPRMRKAYRRTRHLVMFGEERWDSVQVVQKE